jgi:transcriptional regulator with XRE-family HTH domain
MGKNVDDNSIELKKQLQDIGLTLKDIAGDGNCLFRAISDQLKGSPNYHLEIRERICDHIEENEELYQVFLEESLASYCNRMRQKGVYGGNLELVACCRVFEVGIAVHQAAQDIWFVADGDHSTILHIAYHSWEHYSSVRNIDGPFHGPPNIKMIQYTSKNTKKAWERNASEPPTKMEQKIMNQMDLGLEKLPYIRELLSKYRGDPTRVLDQLYEEQEVAAHLDVEPADDELRKTTAETGNDAEKLEESQKDSDGWQEVKPKRITKRQKKDQKRKEKMERHRKKPDTQAEKTLVEQVKMLSI